MIIWKTLVVKWPRRPLYCINGIRKRKNWAQRSGTMRTKYKLFEKKMKLINQLSNKYCLSGKIRKGRACQTKSVVDDGRGF